MNDTLRNLCTLATLAGVGTLVVLLGTCGCVDVSHNLDVRGEAFGVQVIPATGALIGGYGSIDYHQANVVAGQGSMVIYEQYGMTTTNVLSRQVFAVLPATDAKVTFQQQTDWLLCIMGVGIRQPWGTPHTEATVTPKGGL